MVAIVVVAIVIYKVKTQAGFKAVEPIYLTGTIDMSCRTGYKQKEYTSERHIEATSQLDRQREPTFQSNRQREPTFQSDRQREPTYQLDMQREPTYQLDM